MNAPAIASITAATAAAVPALGTPPSAPGQRAALVSARHAVQRPRDARLLVVQADGCVRGLPRHQLVDLLRPGDLLIVVALVVAGVHLRRRRRNRLREGTPSWSQ